MAAQHPGPRPLAPDDAGVAWHSLPAEEALRRLGADAGGLTTTDARARLQRHGPNEIAAGQVAPWWTLVVHQFRDPFIYILLVAAALTAVLGTHSDTAVILAVVVTNAIVGFVQELRARTAMRALAGLSAPNAEVLRDGGTVVLPARDLVPGDVVMLASGARVPADLRLLGARDLAVNEATLTGESLPVRKDPAPLPGPDRVAGDQLDMAFAGTTVTRGRGRGLVVRTGAATELGRIAEAMRAVGPVQTPLQRRMHQFGRQVAAAALLLGVVVAAIGLARGIPLAEVLLTAVALAVSVIPEGLPVVLTITLAIGVHRMSQRKAVVRSLAAVETLGSTTVIGSDKTGTLTRNEMTVRAVWSGGLAFEVTGVGYGREGTVRLAGGSAPDEAQAALVRETLLVATLANEADPGGVARGAPTGDPTEIALHVAALKAGVHPDGAREQHPEVDVLPFEPDRRFMATVHAHGHGHRVLLKGAPEAILPRCATMRTRDGSRALADATARAAGAELAARGLRVLAMARLDDAPGRIAAADLERGAELVGLVGMEDPLRPESVAAVAAAHAAGIRVLMLTGDHAETAGTIGRQLGLAQDGRTVSGPEVDALTDAQLDQLVRETSVFARVAPEHKLRIVQRLAAQGEVVAVTGDGVNDAPALRAAHIGIAMGIAGTDVAREAADMVLADDNFATITAAVEEGRIVFANIRKVTFFLLSTAVGEVLTILVALVAGWPLPFLAAQILWINLATNGLQDVALAFEPGEPGLLRRRPRPAAEGVLTPRLLRRLGGVGLVLGAGSLAMFWWAWRSTGDLVAARSVAMTQMVVFQFFHVFNCRSLDRSVLRIPLFANRMLFASIVAAFGAHLAVLHVPALQRVFHTVALTGHQWLVIAIVGTAVVAGGEADKLLNRRRQRPIG